MLDIEMIWSVPGDKKREKLIHKLSAPHNVKHLSRWPSEVFEFSDEDVILPMLWYAAAMSDEDEYHDN